MTVPPGDHRRAASHVAAQISVAAPIATVFAGLTDHEAMVTWPGISGCQLIVPGTPRNGLGAVRRITALGVTLDEVIVRYEPPCRFDYQIIRGLPVEHLGVVRLSRRDQVVDVDWQVDLDSRYPLVARSAALALGWGLPRALRHVARQVEAAHALEQRGLSRAPG